jgi:hypothetical protein
VACRRVLSSVPLRIFWGPIVDFIVPLVYVAKPLPSNDSSILSSLFIIFLYSWPVCYQIILRRYIVSEMSIKNASGVGGDICSGGPFKKS